MAFPSSPTNGQIAVVSGIDYQFNSTTGTWTRLIAGGVTSGTFTTLATTTLTVNGSSVVTTSSGAGNLTISGNAIALSTVGPGAVTSGSTTAIPVITTDVYGRVTALTTAAITATVNLSGTSGSGSVGNGGTITFAGSNGVTASVSSSTVTIGTPQNLQTTATPTFANLVITSGTTPQFPALAAVGTVSANLVSVSYSTLGTATATTLNATSGLTLNGSSVITTGTIATYAPSLTGTGASGTWAINISGTAATATNATQAGGLSVATGTNNGANQIVRTDSNGYIQAGYINSGAGNEANNSNPPRVWGTNGSDSYMRTYLTSALSVSNASYLNNSYAYTNGTDGWFRSAGQAGWYNASYATGIYATSSQLVQTYNSSSMQVNGALYATSSITAYYSDERLKTQVGKIENALDKVDQLSGFLYVENDLAKSLGFNNTNQQVALSAQAVQRVQPEAVALAPFDRETDGSSKSGENYLTVQYERLVPLLVEAIKELRAELNTVKSQLKG